MNVEITMVERARDQSIAVHFQNTFSRDQRSDDYKRSEEMCRRLNAWSYKLWANLSSVMNTKINKTTARDLFVLTIKVEGNETDFVSNLAHEIREIWQDCELWTPPSANVVELHNLMNQVLEGKS